MNKFLVRELQFLLTFSTAYADIVGGSEKVQKCVEVIYGWMGPLVEFAILNFIDTLIRRIKKRDKERRAIGGFQLLDLIITELKSNVIC